MDSIIVVFGLIGIAYLVSIALLLREFPLSDLSSSDGDSTNGRKSCMLS